MRVKFQKMRKIESWVEPLLPQSKLSSILIPCAESLEKKPRIENIENILSFSLCLADSRTVNSLFFASPDFFPSFRKFSIWDNETEERLVVVTAENILSVLNYSCSLGKPARFASPLVLQDEDLVLQKKRNSLIGQRNENPHYKVRPQPLEEECHYFCPLIIPRQVKQHEDFFSLYIPWFYRGELFDDAAKDLLTEWSTSRKNLRIEIEMPYGWTGNVVLLATIVQTSMDENPRP